MKNNTHPTYNQITFSCECGATFVAGSTIEKKFKTEICSACHPFYTGKQKLVDTSGRVDKFVAKMRKAQESAEKDVKKVKKGKGEDEKAAKKSTKKIEVKKEKVEEKVEVQKEKAEKKKKKTDKKK